MKTSLIVMTGLISFTALAAADARQRPKKAPRQPAQIACTAIGCVPMPPGCGQRPGRTWSGMPTGNDVIVCPPGVAPFR